MNKILLCTALFFSFASFAQNFSLSFDGVDDHVEIPDTSFLNFTNTDSWTIEFWIKANNTNNIYQSIVAKMGTGVNRIGYDVGIASGRIWVHVNNTHISNAIRVNSNSSYNDSSYHHIAATYDGSRSASGVTIYADGIAVATTTTVDNLTGSILNNFPLTIGSRNNGAEPFIGEIDDIRIWKVNKSATEIFSDYTTELNGLDSNIVAYYKFDLDSSLGFISDCGPHKLNGFRKGILGANNTPNFSSSTPPIFDIECGFCVSDSVIQNGTTLTADQTNASYQWLDCNNGYTRILNDTNQTFTANRNGSYAVEITKDGCSDTSNCVSIVTVGLESRNSIQQTLNISPNPSNGLINLEISQTIDKGDFIDCYDINGRIILSVPITVNSNQIDLSHLENGTYFIRYKTFVKKLVLNK